MRPPYWMVWNLFLALVPLALSLWLFRVAKRRGVLWLAGVAAFVVFLPNAPYVLSDTIHLVDRLQAGPSWPTALLLLGGFGAFLLAGLEAYALCITNVRHYLRDRSPWARAGVEVTLHGLSAVGVYLGRVHRFNSWDLLEDWREVLSEAVANLSRPWPVVLVGFTFVVTAVTCEVLVRVNLAALRAVRPNSPES